MPVTAAPWHVLNEKRNNLSATWEADDEPFEYDWDRLTIGLTGDESYQHARKRIPKLTPLQLRLAAKAFKKGTAQTYDGFHVRHFAIASDRALDTAATLLEAVELGGRWPSQVKLVTTPVTPKSKGGFRVVGNMAALYRIWGQRQAPVGRRVGGPPLQRLLRRRCWGRAPRHCLEAGGGARGGRRGREGGWHGHGGP